MVNKLTFRSKILDMIIFSHKLLLSNEKQLLIELTFEYFSLSFYKAHLLKEIYIV